jgi:nuclease A inhibitor-like protein
METTDLKDIFRDAVAGADAAKFRKLISVLNETLADIRVYRIGEIEKDVIIVGKTKAGSWAGLKSKVVET